MHVCVCVNVYTCAHVCVCVSVCVCVCVCVRVHACMPVHLHNFVSCVCCQEFCLPGSFKMRCFLKSGSLINQEWSGTSQNGLWFNNPDMIWQLTGQ